MNQLRKNIEYVLDEYYNGMLNDPEAYPHLTQDEVRRYCIERIYDIKVLGNGQMFEQKDICNELRFLGNEEIYNEISKMARESDVLVK